MRATDPSDALVFFGMTGDLAHKKIFPALYAMVKKGTLDVPVIGVASSKWTVDDLRQRARDSITEYGGGVDDEDAFEKLTGAAALRRRQLQRRDDVHRAQEGARRRCKRPAHYLAIPPSMFETVVEGLGSSGCAENARVIVEKPFGRDLASAQELNQVLHSVFPEQDIFRIDHYLGKEAIQNILYFRFANSFLEPIWNRNYVRSGADHDGRGLRRAGPRQVLRGGRRAARRHPEPPVPDRRAARDGAARRARASRSCATARSRCSRAMETLKPDDLVRGQFEGYRDEPGVAPDSDVETFAAVRLHIDSWRWAGVPFYIRAGKKLPVHVHRGARRAAPAAAAKVFSEYEQLPARHATTSASSSTRASRSRPASGRRPRATASSARSVELYLCNDHPGRDVGRTSGCSATRCDGETLLFAREDGVEASWRVVDNVLTDHGPAIPYHGPHAGAPRSRTG